MMIFELGLFGFSFTINWYNDNPWKYYFVEKGTWYHGIAYTLSKLEFVFYTSIKKNHD
jgi:hypothetical protein